MLNPWLFLTSQLPAINIRAFQFKASCSWFHSVGCFDCTHRCVVSIVADIAVSFVEKFEVIITVMSRNFAEIEKAKKIDK